MSRNFRIRDQFESLSHIGTPDLSRDQEIEKLKYVCHPREGDNAEEKWKEIIWRVAWNREIGDLKENGGKKAVKYPNGDPLGSSDDAIIIFNQSQYFFYYWIEYSYELNHKQ